jgi:hypothetical protein
VALPPRTPVASYRDCVVMTDPVRAWCLVKGEWVEREDPVMAACDPSGGDVHAAMASLGFEAWCQLGYEDPPVTPVALALYSREAPPLQFLLQLEGNVGDIVEHVFAETLPDAMELLAKWAPIAATAAGLTRRRGAPDLAERPPPDPPTAVPAAEPLRHDPATV